MRKLKIYEQLPIVFITAVLLPLCIAAVSIVINVNQHSIREEITYSANITADSVYQRLVKSLEERKLAVSYLAKKLKIRKFKRGHANSLIKEVSEFSDDIIALDLIHNNAEDYQSQYSLDF
ncbi:MAG: hypothetical protein MZU97_02725 [Bacillus subtilis]|nr:hypothetical protein [Bacillus subtilis]